MKLPRIAAAAAVLPFVLSSLAFSPADDAPCYGVAFDADGNATTEVCRGDGFLTDPGRLGNLSNSVTWDDSAPTGSYESGSGSGTYMTSTPAGARVVYEGEFTGDIDSIGIEQYFIAPVDHLVFQLMDLEVEITVDGIPVYSTEDIELTVMDTGSDGVGKVQFVVKGLYDAFPNLQGSTDPHQVRIEMAGALMPWDEALFVYDAVEVPSSVVFNGGDHVQWWTEAA